MAAYVQVLHYLFDTFDASFRDNQIVANTLTAAFLLVIGDLIAQKLDPASNMNNRGCRSCRVWIVGGFIGLFSHYWYGTLEALVTGTGLTVVVKKILWDQAIAGPFFSSFFMIGVGVLEFRSPRFIWHEWKSKIVEIYIADWKVWPLAQFFNFSFVPLRFRVLYVNVITLCWDVYLSYTKHRQVVQQQRRSR